MNSCFCFACIRSGTIGVVERFGRYQRVVSPGLTMIAYPIEAIEHVLSTRIQQLDVECETKTLDNVFVNVVVSIQYQVIKNKADRACYELTHAAPQIRAYVFDVVRSAVPQMELDEAFRSKEVIAKNIAEQLTQSMDDYGFEIEGVLVTDLAPDNRVRNAMNEINANKRMKEAAAEKAEAEKILLVKAAEADAESKYLSGVGVAKQRKAIVDGLKDSVSDFSSNVSGTQASDIISLLMITQYFDMLEMVGNRSRGSTLFLSHSPDDAMNLQDKLKEGMKR